MSIVRRLDQLKNYNTPSSSSNISTLSEKIRLEIIQPLGFYSPRMLFRTSKNRGGREGSFNNVCAHNEINGETIKRYSTWQSINVTRSHCRETAASSPPIVQTLFCPLTVFADLPFDRVVLSSLCSPPPPTFTSITKGLTGSGREWDYYLDNWEINCKMGMFYSAGQAGLW